MSPNSPLNRLPSPAIRDTAPDERLARILLLVEDIEANAGGESPWTPSANGDWPWSTADADAANTNHSSQACGTPPGVICGCEFQTPRVA